VFWCENEHFYIGYEPSNYFEPVPDTVPEGEETTEICKIYAETREDEDASIWESFRTVPDVFAALGMTMDEFSEDTLYDTDPTGELSREFESIINKVEEGYKTVKGSTLSIDKTTCIIGWNTEMEIQRVEEGYIEKKGYFILFPDYATDERIIITLEIEDGTIWEMGVVGYVESTAKQLRGIVSTWYFILRNIALIVLMLLLIYSGIRIVIGSTAGEKAKYKERLTDWLVAICLVFVMHYIMAFSVSIVNQITDLVMNINHKNLNMAYIPLTDKQYKSIQNIDNEELKEQVGGTICEDNEAESKKALMWPTNLIGLYRLQAQLENEGTAKWVGYSFCYVVMVLYTLFFAFSYAKRVVYMAFLTMISPLVALTYPIDKITDGKAQAFDAWLKEYIFNLMIQPLHLLLYSILIVSAFNLASVNAVYALVAVGFMMPAEKLMRRFFGFEKAKTPGLLGGAAGAAIAMSGLQSIMKGGKSGKSGSDNGKSKEQNKVKFVNRGLSESQRMDAIAGGAPTGTPRVNSNVVTPNANNGNSGGANGGANPGANGGANPGTRTITPRGAGSNGGSSNDGQTPPSTPGFGDDDEIRTSFFEDEDDPDGQARSIFGSNDTEEGDNSDLAEQLYEDNVAEMGEDWDHDGFNPNNVGEGPAVDISQSDTPEADAQPADTSYDNLINPDVSEQKTPGSDSKRKRIARAIGTAALGVGKQAAVGVLTGIHPLRLAGKIAAGATVGTAGLLLGVASGDPSKAFQYTTAGAMAGSALANSLSGGKPIVDSEELEMAYYGEDYKQHLVEKQQKEFEKDPRNINYIRQTLGKSEKEAKEILSTTGVECFQKGITDVQDIATIHKMTKESGRDNITLNQAMAARHYAKKRLPSNIDELTGQKQDEYRKTFIKEYAQAGYQNATDLGNKTFDLAIKFNSAQSNLTKHPTR